MRRKARKRAERSHAEAQELLREAANALTQKLGVASAMPARSSIFSHQGIQQLVG
jgi:hypothetical protein